jgi:hypothetical protein
MAKRILALECDSVSRKRFPLYEGLVKYFPDALVYVAEVSYVGGEQHHPGEPVHWERGKSMDQIDAELRHLFQRGTIDCDGLLHSAKKAWRALADLQLELEELGLALSPEEGSVSFAKRGLANG